MFSLTKQLCCPSKEVQINFSVKATPQPRDIPIQMEDDKDTELQTGIDITLPLD